ncbi:MAG: peptide chain release factor 2 [Candidatus Marinimicrobia bacterium]|nr:peptide chain release factor 2 [Candidatus Neomarinimicrobiota bacterium]
MEIQDYINKSNICFSKYEDLRSYLDEKKISDKIIYYESKTSEENFWEDKSLAHNILKKIKYLNDEKNRISKLISNLDLLKFHLEIVNEENYVSDESVAHLNSIYDDLKNFEISSIMSSKDDTRNAILNIHPGAGGKESEDWAFMLFRMYKRWIDQNKFDMNILNYQDGDENGLKDVSIEINGLNAYGNLKSEGGVHRLVRISPFDTNSRRHTSFASVFVYPVIDEDIDISIDDKDLKIDTYRASGAGGQHVNKTDSAVRITHIPTGIVCQCQNQRSQLKNKNIALKILKSKLYEIKINENRQEKNKLNDLKKDISWGSQIRSYVFHPYQMVKDHRTNYETSNIDKILNGDINEFIRKYLLLKMESE